MKNIHILPTDKPSRLYKNLLTDKLFILENSFMDVSECNREYQNIYITSDEEINQQTEPCWCINTIKNTWDDDLIYYQGSMPQYHFKGFKKIILTTVKDLIKDDVQAIDDEFLEWFVKNPSCEQVEVDYGFFTPSGRKVDPMGILQNHSKCVWKYKIIIPKKNFYCGDKFDYDEQCLEQCETCVDKKGVDYGYLPKEESKLIECYFTPKKNTSSATICDNCGEEKFLHNIGEGVKISNYINIPK